MDAIGGRDCLQMVVGGQFPGDVVVRRLSIFRIVLRREQIDRVVAIGLIEANDVGSRRESFLSFS